jgi:hypothetical protein
MYRSKITISDAKLDSFNQSANANEEFMQETIKELQDFISDDAIIKSIKEIFIKFNVTIKTFEDYEDNVNLHGRLINLVDSLMVHGITHLNELQTQCQFINLLDNLKYLTDNVAFLKRICFMRDILNAPDKKKLFSNVFTEESINKRYRKLACYFHPDKTSSLNIPDVLKEEYVTLGTELFKYALELKKSIFKLEESSNNNFQTLDEEKASEFWKIAIDYRNAHKARWDKLKLLKKENLIEIPSEELKICSVSYGKLAYQHYRAACKHADDNKQLKSQIKLRGHMALSLYISEKFMEAQLYALAAIKLVFRNYLNVTKEDLYKAIEIFDKVKGGNPSGSENIQLNTEVKPKYNSHNSCYDLVKTETMVNEFSFLEKKAINRLIDEDLEKISAALILKANGTSTSTLTSCQLNKEEILQAKAYAHTIIGVAIATGGEIGLLSAASSAIRYSKETVSDALSGVSQTKIGIGTIILGLWGGYTLLKRGRQRLEEPKTTEALNKIIKEAYHAYEIKDYQKVFEELSREYKSGSSILKLKNRGDIINHEDMINNLIKHGFRPDGIAYLLILIGEVLIMGNIQIQGKITEKITSEDLKTQGYIIWNGVLSKVLQVEAKKLDERIEELRKMSWKSIENNSSWMIYKQIEDIFLKRKYNRIAEECKESKQSFNIKLEEMRNIAKINLTIRDILIGGSQDIERAKEVIKEIHKSIEDQHQYIGLAEARLEALEDLFWVVSGESA